MSLDTILEAAAQILEESGPKALTTAQLSDRSGYAIGTIYQYLPTKEAIFHELRAREARRIGDAIEEALGRRGDVGPGRTVRRIVDAVVSGFASRLNMRRHVISQTVQDKGIASLFEPLGAFKSEQGDETPRAFIMRHVMMGPVIAALFTRPELFGDPTFSDELARLILGYGEETA